MAVSAAIAAAVSKQFRRRFLIARAIHSSSAAVDDLGDPNAASAARRTSDAPPILDMEDTERLFGSFPTATLLSSLANLSAVAVEPVADLGARVIRSPAVSSPGVARSVVLGAVGQTIYRHFCAGEGVEEAAATVRSLHARGVRGILDYGLEDADDAAACDRNLQGFLRTVDMASSLPPGSVSFACVKITAICPISILERASDLIRWEQRHPSSSPPLPWKTHNFPILTASSPLYHTPAAPPPLTVEEEAELGAAMDRLFALCRRCSDHDGLPLLVDAEYSAVQPAIDHFVYSAASRFSAAGGGAPLVYGTIQAYLRDAKERMVAAMEAAEKRGVALGFKLVRGAYLSRETDLAARLGERSPIHGSVEETHNCYDECARLMLEQIRRRRGSGGGSGVLLATHNVESGRRAAAAAEELGIGKGDKGMQFAQLMGMADGLTLGLRNAGFQVSKYLPFGPVEMIIPYLVRRAEENRGFLSASSVDRALLRRELWRRAKNAVVGSS